MESNTSSTVLHTSANLVAPSFARMAQAAPLFPMYIHLILSALFPIYTGAHASLSRPSSANKPGKKDARRHASDAEEDEDSEEEKVQHMEGLSNTDAIVLPLTAGVVLTGLYYLIQRYGAELINFILGWYFSGIGIYSISQLVNDAASVVSSYAFPAWYRDQNELWHVYPSLKLVVKQHDDGVSPSSSRHSPFPGRLGRSTRPTRFTRLCWAIRRMPKQKYALKVYIHRLLDLNATVTNANGLSMIMGIATVVYANIVSKVWFLTNLQGFAVSYSALQLMSPTSFATGSLILGALFVYDCWAVFFTPLMVTVAKNLDQPIKLVFPRPDEPSAIPGEPPTKSFSMLGLGDIVLPGIMIGLALRFDLYLYYLRKQSRETQGSGETAGPRTGSGAREKATYIPVTGRWGERFWVSGLPAASLPPQLRSEFPKRYFHASLIGYILGMISTLVVMSIFEHAQPALLYLVPGVLSSLWGTALWRGELQELWQYTESVNGEQLDTTGADAPDIANIEQRSRGFLDRIWHAIWIGDGDVAQGGPQRDNDHRATQMPKRSKGGISDETARPQDSDDRLFEVSISWYPSNAPGANASHLKADLDINHQLDDAAQNTTVGLLGDRDATVPGSGKSSPRFRTRGSKDGSEKNK